MPYIIHTDMLTNKAGWELAWHTLLRGTIAAKENTGSVVNRLNTAPCVFYQLDRRTHPKFEQGAQRSKSATRAITPSDSFWI